MYKERTIPVPKALIERLKKMLVRRGKGGLLFPTKNGQPKLNFLASRRRLHACRN